MTTRARNPYVVALVSASAFAWVLAFMLWIVLAEVTDYLNYDAATASALTDWIGLLALVGSMGFIGAAVVAGVAHELRFARRLN